MKKQFAILIIILTSALGHGCSSQYPKSTIDAGKIENGVYRNAYFGINLPIPEDWSVPEKETQEKIGKIGVKMIAGDDKNTQNLIDIQTTSLFSIYRYPLGTPKPNFGLQGVAEIVGHMPAIKSGKDYLLLCKQVLEGGRMEISFGEEISQIDLDGVIFDVMHMEMAVMGRRVLQKQLATVKGEYALLFTLSFTDEVQEAELMGVLDNLKFE